MPIKTNKLRNSMHVTARAATAIAVTAIASALLALAAQAGSAATAEQKAACTPDVWRLCSAEVPNVSKIVACLNRNHDKLSPGCRVVMNGGTPRKSASH